jgi:hypothetical protein
MALVYLSIPLMVAGMAIAVVPLLWAMKHQAGWDQVLEIPRGQDAKNLVVFRSRQPAWPRVHGQLALAELRQEHLDWAYGAPW